MNLVLRGGKAAVKGQKVGKMLENIVTEVWSLNKQLTCKKNSLIGELWVWVGNTQSTCVLKDKKNELHNKQIPRPIKKCINVTQMKRIN
jgi:hypothetical protein